MKRAVLFDFDGTLLPEPNSLMWHFVRNLQVEGLRAERTLAFVQAMSHLIPRAALSLIEHDAMFGQLLHAVFGGLPVWAARQSAERLAPHIERTMFPRMREVLTSHEGDHTFLVTANAAPLFWVFCEQRAMTCVASELEIRDGTFTGALASALCKGEEKVERISAHLVGEPEVVAYGNSLEDLPMLSRADRPVLVNPDRGLSRVSELCWAPRIFVDAPRSAFGA